MKKWLFILLIFPLFISAQALYNPQDLYDNSGGLFDKDSLRSLYINFEDPNYHSVLQNSFFTNPSYRIPATITLNGTVYDSAGVRYKGNSTFCIPNDNGNPKVPYNIDMNYWVSGQKILEYKKIKLANAYMDATFAKEFASSRIYKKYLPTAEVNLMKLYVQGNYLGIYVNTESINKQFLDKHFDEKSGVLFKCDGSGMFCDTTGTPQGGVPDLNWKGAADSTLYYTSYNLKSESGWAELINLIATLNFNLSELDSVLNIDRVLWAFAVNTVIANLDTYNGYYVHNYYLYQTKDGLFQMIPWDLSQAFINALLGWDFGTGYPQNYDPYYGEDPSIYRPLTEKLFSNPLYRKQYTAHLRTVINELDTSTVRSEINQLQALGYSAVNTDNNKLFSINDYTDNIENDIQFWLWGGYGFGGIMSTIDARKQYLLSHPEIALLPPTLYGVNVSNNLVTVNAINASSLELMATTSEFNSKFQSFVMLDDGTNGDVMANDGIYSVVLPFQSGGLDVKFYIRAQNNDAMALLPERAEYEFYTYSIVSGFFDTSTTQKRLMQVTDLLGRTISNSKSLRNIPLIYIYDDGSVEKKIIVN